MTLCTAAGYAPYISETLFNLKSAPPVHQYGESDWPGVRPQRQADSFALQRLNACYTPPLIQQAEGALVGNGEPPSPLNLLAWWQPEHVEGFVCENDRGDILAAAHLIRGRQAHWLRLFGEPDAGAAIDALLARSLEAFAYYSDRPIYCPLRPYQSSYGPQLRRFAFEPGPVLSRLVKHTTSFVRKPVAISTREFVEAPVPGLIPTETRLIRPAVTSDRR